MKMLLYPILLAVMTVFAGSPNRASAEDTPPANNIKSETKPLKGRQTTVFVSSHGAMVVIQVSIVTSWESQPIKYDDVSVRAIDDQGTELPIRQLVPTAWIYGQMKSNAVGAYVCTLQGNQKLTGVEVKRETEKAVFAIGN